VNAVVGIVLGCVFGVGAVIAVAVGKAARLADEKESGRDFNQHVESALDLLDPATPHLGWPAGVVPLRADVYRVHHDRRGGAR
jgi:hypothetical protein